MASNSILSLSGIESRIAKLDSVLSAIIPTVEADIAPAAADVAAVVGGVAGAVASGGATAIASVGPVASGFMGLLAMIEGLVSGLEAAMPGSAVPPSVGTLTGAEVSGPNKA